ncbi:MAG TPA: hypothetical protein VMQ67_07745 [Candidatus Saccharimonadales bacterium]|jgi:hypothetical protein|nr:hypothetical protein [Candidatus Saccharimonadales bacterium]
MGYSELAMLFFDIRKSVPGPESKGCRLRRGYGAKAAEIAIDGIIPHQKNKNVRVFCFHRVLRLFPGRAVAPSRTQSNHHDPVFSSIGFFSRLPPPSALATHGNSKSVKRTEITDLTQITHLTSKNEQGPHRLRANHLISLTVRSAPVTFEANFGK